MATAPLLLLIAAAIPRPCDVALVVWHAAESAVVAPDVSVVDAAPKSGASPSAPDVQAVVPAVVARVKRPPPPPVLVDAAPLRVVAQAPAMAARRTPAQPQAPPPR